MRGAFDGEDDFERPKSSGDAEFTLGAGTLLFLVLGLFVLCGVCFGTGYLIGHRGAAPTTEGQQASDAPSPQAANSQSKPSATSQAAPMPAPPASVDSATQPQMTNPSQPPAAAVTVPVPPAPGTPTDPTQQQVRPALPPSATAGPQPVSAYPSHPAESAAQSQVRSATQQSAVQLWVQIAAVSRIEDAQVLTKALQKRGYAVTPRREADSLIHVRVGPFSSRDEATRWRSRLLDDGYNAEIQQ